MTTQDAAFIAAKLTRIDVGTLSGKRPRSAGSNARLDDHGIDVRTTFARFTTSDGITGFGQTRASKEQLQSMVGKPLTTVFGDDFLIADEWLAGEFPLWDLYGHYAGKPVYALLAERAGRTIAGPMRPPCYDTSLYFDDLNVQGETAAAELMAHEAAEGFARGHRAFKIKIGRGARHMPLEVGTRRDIAIIRAVRQQVGADAIVMVDANNGYNLNLTKRVLVETRDCNLYWFEEAFHEDDVLYVDLQSWLKDQGIGSLIADGEGLASPRLMDWARAGAIDIVQYDIIDRGLSGWVRTGEQLDAWGVKSAPHVYGGMFGPFACAHLSAAIQHFELVEWDLVTTEGFDTFGYTIDSGVLVVPDAPGFGLNLDSQRFAAVVAENGFSLGS